MPLVLASQNVGGPDVSNGSHFGYFLFVHLLPTWLDPSYMAELSICTWATHRATVANVLKILILFLNFHFLNSHALCTLKYIRQ